MTLKALGAAVGLLSSISDLEGANRIRASALFFGYSEG